jgi:hypothetical protein
VLIAAPNENSGRSSPMGLPTSIQHTMGSGVPIGNLPTSPEIISYDDPTRAAPLF